MPFEVQLCTSLGLSNAALAPDRGHTYGVANTAQRPTIMSSQQCLRTSLAAVPAANVLVDGRKGREHSLALIVHVWYGLVVLTEAGS